MREDVMITTDEIDLKSLCIFMLREWRKILLAAAVFAVLLGGYKTVGWLTEQPQSVLSEEEISDTQAQIESYENAIASDQTNIPLQEAELERLKEQKANYEEALEKATEVENVTAEVVSDVLSINETIDSLNSQISSTESYISSMYNEIASYTAANEVSRAQLEETITSKSPKDIVTGVILGALLGAALVCGWMAFKYVLDGRLESQEDMESRYGMVVLADVVATEETTAKFGGKIDQLITRIRGESNQSAQNAYQIAAAKLELLCQNGRKLLFTGTVSSEKLQEVFNGIKACLPVGEYQLAMAENPMYSPDSLAQLQEAEVILVEEVNTSRLKEMDKLVVFLVQANVSIVGAVVV